MQNFNKFNNSDYISDAPEKLNGNFQTVASDFAGASFPTTDLVEGMTCYRTDEGIEYRYVGGKWISSFATQAEAESGSNNTKVMTPKGVDYRLNKDRSLKTYTSFGQLGLSSTATLLEVVNAMPKESQFVQYIGANSYEAFGVPQAGTITIVKAQGANYANLWHQRYGGDNVVRKAWFENWGSGQSEFRWKEVLTDDKFATQAEAEAGVDDTKVMTPLRMKNAIDYNNATNRLPNTNYSVDNVVYDRSNLSVSLKCTQLGTTSNTELDISTKIIGDTVTDGSVVWQVVKRSNILDEVDVLPIANGGTGGNTARKARENLNVRLQTFTSLEQLGLDDTATPEQIAKALPENSEISFYAITAMQPTLGQPVNGSCRIEKRSTVNYSTVNFFLYAQTTVEIYYGVYSSYNGIGFSGWKKFAINGALSMPELNKSGVAISVSSLLNGTYVAPTDGWIAGCCVGTGSIKNWMMLSDAERTAYAVQASVHETFGLNLLLPISKGRRVKMVKGDNVGSVSAVFYPAQSEV